MHDQLDTLLESMGKVLNLASKKLKPEVINGRLVYTEEMSHNPSGTLEKISERKERNKDNLQSIYNPESPKETGLK